MHLIDEDLTRQYSGTYLFHNSQWQLVEQVLRDDKGGVFFHVEDGDTVPEHLINKKPPAQGYYNIRKGIVEVRLLARRQWRFGLNPSRYNLQSSVWNITDWDDILEKVDFFNQTYDVDRLVEEFKEGKRNAFAVSLDSAVLAEVEDIYFLHRGAILGVRTISRLIVKKGFRGLFDRVFGETVERLGNEKHC